MNNLMINDLYQFSMAYAYWKQGMDNQEAVFHMFYRKNPFNGNYAIACGLQQVIDVIDNFEFTNKDIKYLSALKDSKGERLFELDFLRYLMDLEFTCSIDAIPEGTIVFPNEPLIRVTGPLLQCQLLETPILNIINFQTLIATKASRIKYAAKGDSVLEFGARRAAGPDGALSASRAAYIGGADATSNLAAGIEYDIPVKGTHAHSWVMSFDNEEEAFFNYAEALPGNCVFLVDTYNTIQGVKNAIKVTKEYLRPNGYDMLGIRLDSGDLAALSIEARHLLDEAGLENANIVASNDLDEYLIEDLKQQGAKINVWGVGTKLVTGGEQSALGGVYKLSALRKNVHEWTDKIKLSENIIKVSNPGIQQVRRYMDNDSFKCDVIYNDDTNYDGITKAVDSVDNLTFISINEFDSYCDLLEPVYLEGNKVRRDLGLDKIRENLAWNLKYMKPAIRRFNNPQYYPVGLELSVFDKKLKLIEDRQVV